MTNSADTLDYTVTQTSIFVLLLLFFPSCSSSSSSFFNFQSNFTQTINHVIFTIIMKQAEQIVLSLPTFQLRKRKAGKEIAQGTSL